MNRPWPIIAVADVPRSSAWYRMLLQAHQNHLGAALFNQILDEDGTVLLCLHCGGRRDRRAITSARLSRIQEEVGLAMASFFGSWWTTSM